MSQADRAKQRYLEFLERTGKIPALAAAPDPDDDILDEDEAAEVPEAEPDETPKVSRFGRSGPGSTEFARALMKQS